MNSRSESLIGQFSGLHHFVESPLHETHSFDSKPYLKNIQKHYDTYYNLFNVEP